MAVIKGTIKAETLIGTAGLDTITGLAGNDLLRGLGGNDTLDGGTGEDKLYGGTGDDTYIVDSAADKIFELANEGSDLIKAGISFALAANIEKLLLTGTGAISGTGNSGANTLTGNGAANVLKGLGGNDVLVGGGGNDVLVGGIGMDTLTGGTGFDRFAFDDGDFSSKTATGADVIADFTKGDKIDLALVDAVSSSTPYNQPGDQAFVFIGRNRFHIETGRELRYDVIGGNTYVYGNVNGDATADFCIKILGVHTLTSSDFVL